MKKIALAVLLLVGIFACLSNSGDNDSKNMRAIFKKRMDLYEAYWSEQADYMGKRTDLFSHMIMIEKFNETAKELKEFDKSKLSPEDLEYCQAYYNEVESRVSKKLLGLLQRR
ncbi:hypothetical protein FACS1894187_26090 [Synergistales bacterium]|nr:hypothetical protein FACS1894187_26090 [Synergistales bacterium]